MATPNRILVFRNGSIGNTLAAVPALRCLRESFPNARIHVLVDRQGNELLQNCPYLDSLVVYDRNGADRGLVGFLRIATMVRALNPDTCILFKRFFRNGLLAKLSGATRRIGFVTDGKAPFLNEAIPYDESVHVAELNLRLVRFVSANATVPPLPEVFVTQAEQAEAHEWLIKNHVNASYTVVHFGGVTTGADFISFELRVALIQTLAANDPTVIIGNGVAELQAASRIKEVIPKVVNATGLPLRQTMALIAGAGRFIGTNSGPMHIAAAARIPGIALFKRDDRYEIERIKWHPLFDNLKIVPVHTDNTQREVVELALQAWPTN